MATPNEDIEHVVPPAEVTVDEDIDLDDEELEIPEDAQLLASVSHSGLYQFAIKTRTFWDTGLRASPRCGAKNAKQQAVWRAHSGGGKMVVWFKIRGIGYKPPGPHPDSLGENNVLVHAWVESVGPFIMLDGVMCYTTKGRYVYELQKPPAWSDPLPGVKHPLSDDPANASAVTVAGFDTGMVEATPPEGFINAAPE